MSEARLFDAPHVTREVLRLVIKGSNTQEELAEELGCAERTVYNKVHDPKVLGFLERKDGKYVITDKEELMKLFQLDDRAILKKRFENLPGVEEINDELVGGSLSFTRVGRIVSYYTNSEAIDEDAFNTYGRIYAQWFDYLGMGYASNQQLSQEKPMDYNKNKTTRKDASGGTYPLVRPDKVFQALRAVEEGITSTSELSDQFESSEREVSKILRSCYLLNLAAKNNEVQLTEIGKKAINSSEAERSELIRDELLELNLIKTYCKLAPDEPFKNRELMQKVGEELDKNWSENTVDTKAKRLYQWLIYSDLFKEVKRGTLVPTATASQSGLSSIEDYA